MLPALAFSILFCISVVTAEITLPTVYEYYTNNGIKSGLSADQPYFTLNGKNISIYSGSIHYFRVPRQYWRDRLRKLRAAGFNTVETYIPWNLHEYQSGRYDFGNGDSDMTDFLHLEEFLQLAQEEDLLSIIRSGPFICAEFEFGGFPSWLLREKDIVVRSSNEIYMKYVTRWFNVLMPLLAKYQFTQGGPIIALQVENEFAGTGGRDKDYLKQLRKLMLNKGIVELLVTSDNPWRGRQGTITDLFLMTGNFDKNPVENLDELKSNQTGKPVMAMEFWSGWFDYWGQSHQTKNISYFGEVYEAILSYPASANIYMFIGGTSFGFLNGAQNLHSDDLNTRFTPITTSYDYSAPLSENGDYTDKYYAAQALLAKYNPIKTKLPDMPTLAQRVAYTNLTIEQEISFEDFLETSPSEVSDTLVSMEQMDINNGSGQSFGYIVYRKANLNLSANSVLQIVGRVCDTLIVLVNGQRVSPVLELAADLNKFGTWRTENSTLQLTDVDLTNATLDLIVENWGRVNIAVYKQYKGLWQGDVAINDVPINQWTLYALEFRKSWTNTLSSWKTFTARSNYQPKLYKTTLNIIASPRDTYVYTENWTKGIVIVNGFVLGRYSRMGPQQTLYLPAPLLKQGRNDIVVFEHFTPGSQIEFLADPVFELGHS